MVERLEDTDATVRQLACRAIAFAPPDTPDITDLLAARLPLRDDPRGDDILQCLDPADEDSPHHWLLYDVYRHRAGYR
ncbi:hypothetical protein [Embleya hyalina]|uniref:Uncharacterized protein n=1 Tax=Embleya hyalina TaxID=516124 RepID=A0A401YNG6_9ACTN|nr:hypothetical protein [Embleya hyalina]GCD96141.1 hypothetical protein EHYA_03825 [Embleya hyalina]